MPSSLCPLMGSGTDPELPRARCPGTSPGVPPLTPSSPATAALENILLPPPRALQSCLQAQLTKINATSPTGPAGRGVTPEPGEPAGAGEALSLP